MNTPFEDIVAPDLPDDTLLNDAQGKIIIGILTNELRRARLFSNNTDLQAAWGRMQEVTVGDLVLITDIFNQPEPTDAYLNTGIGYLLAVRDEYATSDVEWKAAKSLDDTLTDDDRYIMHDVYYLQYGPSHICRWVNANVVKVDRVYTRITVAVTAEETPDGNE